MTVQGTQGMRVSRRGFFQWLVWAIGGVFGVLLGAPLIGYFLSPIFRKAPIQWVRVCTLDEINPVTPVLFRVGFRPDGAHVDFEDVRGVFVILRGAEVLAFTNTCTHMSCSVRWLDWRQQILCPCHGGIYDRWGNLVGGPPPHRLPFYLTRVEDNVVYVANRFE